MGESGDPGLNRARGPGLVVALLGPTATGKTAVAVQLAMMTGAAVISCDSMQVYRGFPVLTNQPSAEEQAAAPHLLVACVEPGEPFSAAEYAELARPLIKKSLEACGWALVVGGSGLYMRAALAPLASPGPSDPALRSLLEARAETEGAPALHAELARVDPAAAAAIDHRNVRRVVRALEAVGMTGREWSGRSDLWEPAYDHPTMVLGLALERSLLYECIDSRAAAIVEGGAVDEVGRFREAGGEEATVPGAPGICSAIGYREICGYLDGSQTREATVERVAAATRKYARRQLTWLYKLKDAVIIDQRAGDAQGTAQAIIARAERGDGAEEPRRP